MTADELQVYRAKSARLREIVMRMDPGDDRAAIAFAAGTVLGLANRLNAVESFPRPFVVGTRGDGLAPAFTATIARKIYLTEGMVTHLERMRARMRDSGDDGVGLGAELAELLELLQIK